ncbi:CD109 antigen-like [Saccoglossus kowalevskii]
MTLPVTVPSSLTQWIVQAVGVNRDTVIPLKVGDFPIQIVAFSPIGGDIVERILKLEPTGVQRSFEHSVLLDPSGLLSNIVEVDNTENTDQGPVKNIEHKNFENHRQSNELDIRMSADVIPDSPECRVNISGNLMGPTVSAVISDNIQDLITKPRGCGEQTLIRTAPNLYTLMYLSAINRLTPDI